MRQEIWLIIFLFLFSPLFADMVCAQDGFISSGFTTSGNATDFATVGEDSTGIISSANYLNGVGFPSFAFSPGLSSTASNTVTVSRVDNNALCYPNPFNPGTENITITYLLTADQEVKIYIMDMTGVIVKTIIANSSNRAADGYSRATWDGRTPLGDFIPNGVYIVKIVSNGASFGSTKMMALQ